MSGPIRTLMLLVVAAALEVGGDALIRSGLKNRGIALMIGGVAVLAVYGFFVNSTPLDFGRLMGLYIVLFFFVAQCFSVLIFKERLTPRVLIGGILIAAGGIVMTAWR